MTKVIIAGIAGFAVGLFVAKMAYESKVRGGIHTALDTVGLGGGFVESTVDKLAGVGT